MIRVMPGAVLAAVLGLSSAAADEARVQVSSRAVLIATIDARCDQCAWNAPGREAVTLRVSVNGRYASHVPLVRPGPAEYKVLAGTVEPGTHAVTVSVDAAASARGLQDGAAASARVTNVAAVPESSPEFTALSFAPILYARPNTIGRFTDVPVFTWYEVEPTNRGTRYRYSVIFTNEDGGTPADRLMATWGRTTDIEYVYSVEVDAKGTVLADDIQGPEHKILAFAGKREARHPLLWVSTDNNMVLPSGTTQLRYAPAPVAFPLKGVSREAIMDAHPWLYAVAAQELEREGKILEDPPPGKGAIPDPRRFVYIEGCGVVGEAALAFEVAVGPEWYPSDRGVPQYRIVRDGCFRAAVPVPPGTRDADIRGLRVLAHPRVRRDGKETPDPPPIRLERINTVFMLDRDHRPGPAVITWVGPADVTVADPIEVAVSR